MPAANSQGPYRLEQDQESLLLGGAILALGLGFHLKQNAAPLTAQEIGLLQPGDIGRWDRWAIGTPSPNARKLSDLLLYASLASPMATLKPSEKFGELVTIGFLYGETLLLATGITFLTKYTVKRSRPFVYDPGVPLEEKTNLDARASFFSGHTAISAASCFFAARVYTDYHPQDRKNPVIWTLAALLPATTGYLRIRAEKHFPTDVLTGFLAGAICGWGIPEMHLKKGGKMTDWSFQVMPGTFRLTWHNQRS